MSSFQVIPISPSVADTIRSGPRDASVRAVTANKDGGFPCRICLEDATAGEELLLFPYSPFERPGPYRTVGPIYAHARACRGHSRTRALPPLLTRRLLSLRAYDEADLMVAAEVVEGASAAQVIDRLFDNPRARTIHVHIARPGCFVCEVRRAQS